MKVAGIRVPAFPLLFCVFARSFPVVCTRDPAPGKFRGPAPAAGPARVFAMACTLDPCRVELNVTFPSKPKFVRLPIRSKSLATLRMRSPSTTRAARRITPPALWLKWARCGTDQKQAANHSGNRRKKLLNGRSSAESYHWTDAPDLKSPRNITPLPPRRRFTFKAANVSLPARHGTWPNIQPGKCPVILCSSAIDSRCKSHLECMI